MAQQIGIDLQARTGAAQKELQQFGRFLDGLKKSWGGFMGKEGTGQANAGLQQMSKGMAQFAKSAELANSRLKATSGALADVRKQLKDIQGIDGSIKLADKETYKRLLDQEKSLSRQQKSWAAIAANRQLIAKNAPGSNGNGGGGTTTGAQGALAKILGSMFRQASGGAIGEAGGILGTGGAAGIMEAVGPALGTAILATLGFGVKGFKSALDLNETEAKFLPRMYPGGMRGVNPSTLSRRMRAVGRPLAYNVEESHAIFEAMSEGGSNFGRGLEADSHAAMAYARMFGLDAGATAGSFATAQRMGTFKAGDAKKFASMLAQEIARSGLGPRAQEVQDATLMLLNRQMQDQPRANPGSLMALQTILNKTGVPAFQGTMGASLINQMQDSITHPNSEAAEALNFAVARKMGAKSFYDVQMIQARGLNDPRFLATQFGMIHSSSGGNPEKEELALSQFYPSVGLPKIHALRMSLGGSFANLTGSRMTAAMKALKGGETALEKGAATATEAFDSLAIKQAQITIHEATLRVGENILPKVAGMARGVGKFISAADSHPAAVEKGRLMGSALAGAAGFAPGSTAERAAGATGGFIGDVAGHHGLGPYIAEKIGANRLDAWLQRTFEGWMGPHAHTQGLQVGPAVGLAGAMDEMLHAGLHPTITSAFRTRGEQARARYLATHGLSHLPAARPGHSAHERGEAVDISVPAAERARANEIMAAHGFVHNVPHDPPHYAWGGDVHVHIHDHTAESHSRVTRVVRDAVDKIHHDRVRTMPNTRNPRR